MYPTLRLISALSRTNVEAQARAAAGVGLQQSAHHADRRRLAASIRSEKSEDLAPPHAQRNVLHHVLVVEVLVQPLHVDGELRIARPPSLDRHLDRLAGMQRASPVCADGLAITMYTSFDRFSLL